jgi:hypothetical protein
MARSYKRDKKGRFASTGGGGKLGKSEKNEKARAKYKAAASAARDTAKTVERRKAAGTSDAGDKIFGKAASAAKGALTRVTKGLHGGTAGNLGASKAAPKAAPKAKAAPKSKAAATPKASAPKTRRQPSSPRGLDGPQRRTSASTVAKADANARLSEGRRLKGKGNNPTARAERNLERAMASKGRKARKSEATAARAIDYMAKTGKLGKRSNGTKKRRG